MQVIKNHYANTGILVKQTAKHHHCILMSGDGIKVTKLSASEFEHNWSIMEYDLKAAAQRFLNSGRTYFGITLEAEEYLMEILK